MGESMKYNNESYELVWVNGSFGNRLKDEYCQLLIGHANNLLPCWKEIRMDADGSMWAYCGSNGDGIECNEYDMWETFSVHEPIHARQIDVFDNVIGLDWGKFGIIKHCTD